MFDKIGGKTKSNNSLMDTSLMATIIKNLRGPPLRSKLANTATSKPQMENDCDQNHW